MQQETRPATVDWLILIALMLVWGSSFILIKKGLEGFSNIQVGALRVAISFVALLPLAIVKIKQITSRNFYLFLIAGVLGNAIPAFLFAKAQTGLDSYMAGTLNSLTPLFTLLLGVGFFGRKTRLYNVFGVIIGLAGAAGLLYYAGGGSFELNLYPALLIVLATMCYALQMNYIKNYLTGYDATTIAPLAFIFIGIPSIVFLVFGTDFIYRIHHVEGAWASLGYISVLSVFGTALAIMASYWLIKRTSALFASSVTYLMPVVSIGWGVFDGEMFLPSFILWIAVILAGVYLANRSPGNIQPTENNSNKII